jgi:hypothetical protein
MFASFSNYSKYKDYFHIVNFSACDEFFEQIKSNLKTKRLIKMDDIKVFHCHMIS